MDYRINNGLHTYGARSEWHTCILRICLIRMFLSNSNRAPGLDTDVIFIGLEHVGVVVRVELNRQRVGDSGVSHALGGFKGA